MTKPHLFVEPFAGAAAVSLRLIGGRRLQPPVSWMGGKRRHAAHILHMMGLRSGLGTERLVLGDAGPWGWVWPVLLHKPSAALVADRLRSWSEEDPRELWRRLADAPPADAEPDRVAQWLWLQGRAGGGVPVFWIEEELNQGERPTADGKKRKKPGQKGLYPPKLIQHKSNGKTTAAMQKGLRLPQLMQGDHNGRMSRVGPNRDPKGSGGLVDIVGFADRLELLAETVATWLALQSAGALGKPVRLEGGAWKHCGYAHLSETSREKGFKARLNPASIADKVDGLPAPAVSVYHGNAGELLRELGEQLNGAHVYMDPPYKGCTGYGWDCAREQVLELATFASDAGAIVALSEAVPLADELGPGWESQDITSLGRVSAKPEWVTINRPAQARVAIQTELWSNTGATDQ